MDSVYVQSNLMVPPQTLTGQLPTNSCARRRPQSGRHCTFYRRQGIYWRPWWSGSRGKDTTIKTTAPRAYHWTGKQTQHNLTHRYYSFKASAKRQSPAQVYTELCATPHIWFPEDCAHEFSSFERFTTLSLNTDPHQTRVIEITYAPAVTVSSSAPARKYKLTYVQLPP